MVNKLLFQILKPVYTDILKSQMEECIDQSIDEYFESHRQAPTIEHIGMSIIIFYNFYINYNFIYNDLLTTLFRSHPRK